MTYEQLCKDFLFNATKTTAQYKQGNYLIRLVKIPVNKHVEALYMSYNYMGRKEYHQRMEINRLIKEKKAAESEQYEFFYAVRRNIRPAY